MKHSKLFLTGMAALLLSFGLMMTGCDSGGDSDDGDPINAGDYISIVETTQGADNPPVAAVYTVTVKQLVPATNKAVFTNVADAAVEYIPALGDETTKAAQAEAIKTALNGAAGAKYTAAVGTTVGTDDHVITLTALADGAIANAPAVAIETYTAPQTSDQTADITAAEDDTAFAVTATGGTIKNSAKVFIKNDGTAIVITNETTLAGHTVVADTKITRTTGKIVVKGLAVAGTATYNDGAQLKVGTVTVTLKADAQQSGASGVAAHTGVPVVVPEEGGGAGYTVVAAASGVGDNNAKLHYDSTSKVLKYNETDNNSETTATLDEDFDAALIAVFTNTALGLTTNDTITFGAGGAITDIGVVASPTAAKVTAAFGVVDEVTLGDDLTLAADFAVPAEKTLTVAATKKLTVAASKTLTVSGTLAVGGILAWTDDTSVLIIQAGGEVTGTAAAAFHAKAGTITTGASLSLTVTAASDPATATGWTTANASAPASVTFTSATAGAGSGSAYVLGNASLAINNASTAHAVSAVVSTAADSAAAGGIKAGTGSAVVITGASA